MKLPDVKVIELTIQELMASQLFDDEAIPPGNVRAWLMYRMEYLAHQLTAGLKVPAKVLQDRRLIAEYPDGLWQHIRQKLGWQCRTKQVRLTEWLAFPTIEVPDIRRPMRIYVQSDVLSVDPRVTDDY